MSTLGNLPDLARVCLLKLHVLLSAAKRERQAPIDERIARLSSTAAIAVSSLATSQHSYVITRNESCSQGAPCKDRVSKDASIRLSCSNPCFLLAIVPFESIHFNAPDPNVPKYSHYSSKPIKRRRNHPSMPSFASLVFGCDLGLIFIRLLPSPSRFPGPRLPNTLRLCDS